MSEFSATLPLLELSATLWLAPALPLAAALFLLLRSVAGEVPREFAARVTGLSIALALGAWLLDALRLFGDEAPAALLCQLTSVARIGSFDAALSFSVDPVTAVAAAAVLLVAGVAVWIEAPRQASATEFAGLALSASGALIATLSDDAWLTATGFAVLAVASAWLLAASHASAVRLLGTTMAGSLLLILAVGIASWSFAGAWTADGDYIPDYRARLLAVQGGDAVAAAKPAPDARPSAPRDADGSLTLTALPGATISVGGAQLCALDADGKVGGVGIASRPCQRVARAPFVRLPVPAALHDVTVSTGPGAYDLLVSKVRVTRNAETTLALSGATLSPRLLADQLRLRDASGVYPLRAALDVRRVLGARASTVVGVLLALMLVAFAAGFPSTRALRESAGSRLAAVALAGMGLVAVMTLGARHAFLFSLAPKAASVLGLLFALGSVWLGARAVYAKQPRAALVWVAGVQLGVGLTGVAVGAGSVAALHAASVGVGLAALLLLTSDGDLVQFLGCLSGKSGVGRTAGVLAAVVSAAPIPVFGAFWARESLLRSALALDDGWVPGWAVVAVALVATSLAAFAVWRVVLIGAGKPPKGVHVDPPPSSALPYWLLAAVGGVIGVLAASGPLLGGETLVPRLFAPAAVEGATAPLPGEVQLFVGLATFALALVGWWFAHRRYRGVDAKQLTQGEAKRGGALADEPAASETGWVPQAVLTIGHGVVAVEALLAGPPAPDPSVEERADSQAAPPQSEVRPRKKKSGSGGKRDTK